MSELLRRAARRRDPAADRLQGDAWLAFLDGDRASDVARPFSEGTGRVLLEGGFRREVDAAGADALLPLARARYLELMAVRRSEEHTSELQSLMRISYAVFCLKQKNNE